MEKQRYCPACGSPITLDGSNMFSCSTCGAYGKDFSKNITPDEIEMLDEMAFQKRVKEATTKVDVNELHKNYNIKKIAKEKLNLLASLGGIKLRKNMPNLKDIKEAQLAYLGGIKLQKQIDSTGLSEEDKKKLEIAQRCGIKLKKGTVERMKEKDPKDKMTKELSDLGGIRLKES